MNQKQQVSGLIQLREWGETLAELSHGAWLSFSRTEGHGGMMADIGFDIASLMDENNATEKEVVQAIWNKMHEMSTPPQQLIKEGK